jgi:hypothetical protein
MEPEDDTEGHVKLLARKGSWRGSIEVLLQRKASKKNLKEVCQRRYNPY